MSKQPERKDADVVEVSTARLEPPRLQQLFDQLVIIELSAEQTDTENEQRRHLKLKTRTRPLVALGLGSLGALVTLGMSNASPWYAALVAAVGVTFAVVLALRRPRHGPKQEEVDARIPNGDGIRAGPPGGAKPLGDEGGGPPQIPRALGSGAGDAG